MTEDEKPSPGGLANLVEGQQRLLRVEKIVLDRRGPFLRQRQLRVGDRRQQARELDAGERDEVDAHGDHVDVLDTVTGKSAGSIPGTDRPVA